MSTHKMTKYFKDFAEFVDYPQIWSHWLAKKYQNLYEIVRCQICQLIDFSFSKF